MRNSCRTLCGVALVGIIVLLIAVLVTWDLPTSRMYEARYEFRLRDYQKNIDQPESVLNGLSLMDSYDLCDYLSTLSDKVDVRCDKTRKITLVARHIQADSAELLVRNVYLRACDTVRLFGDNMCLRKAAEYIRQIDSLRNTPLVDSMQTLLCRYYDRLAILQADAEGGMKYIEVLNSSEAGVAYQTTSRWLVVALASVVAMMMGFGLVFLKKIVGQ